MDNIPPVYAELPPGFLEEPDTFSKARLARSIGRVLTFLHYCPQCGGWVAGLPAKREENSLKGRTGTARVCRRCGTELGFFGFLG